MGILERTNPTETKRARRECGECGIKSAMEDEWDDDLLSKIDDLESLHLQAAAERQAAQQQQRFHTGGPPAATAAAEAQWTCRSCTLLNTASRATCLVCSTPRGQAFHTAAVATPGVFSGNGASAAGAGSNRGGGQTSVSFSASQAAVKRTVQATLPFAPPVRRPVENPAPAAAPRPQPVPAPPTTSPYWPQPQQQSSHRQQPRLAFPVANRSPPQPQRQLPHNPAKETVAAAIDGDGDDLDNPDAVNAVVWPIAYATLQHRPGEDNDAKTRYLDILNRSNFPEVDYEAAQQFVYPTNYPIREYQLTITEKALYHNTMVSLPTGLGKTLIASVIMYNFYRWFPQGKIVFMAPTKPLVAQQIKACHEIMGIPLSDTAELQGNVPPSTRKVLWKEKRVFFCTPQSMQNDLRHGICEAERFVCLVIDEAHRATGNYAYCCVIQEIEKKTQFFRVLALSATPGAKFEIIQDVIKNLRISHIESRSADDADVKKYTHARQEEVIKCTLSSQITEVKDIFLKVFQRIVHRLVSGNIIQHYDPEKLSRWYVLQMREKFRQSPSYQTNRAAESDLALLVSLLHAKDLLTVHGLSSFQEYVSGWIEERETGTRLSWSKKEMLQSAEFHSLVLSLNALGMGYSSKSSNEKSSSSHPKLLKLREVLHEHFQRHSTGNSSTRAIVFTQYRTSVTEIVGLLEQMAPLLKVQAFVGQGASGKAKESKGQSQKQQQEIVKKFRNGEFNVLVATCIAEEGLDIGEVDLIVSFDALTSPVRMIQRMGRTGRKRVGKVIILVTEGDEEKKLARSVASAKTVSRAMTTFKSKFIYSKCPRMIPNGIQPELSKLEMVIPEFHPSQVGGKQRTPGQVTRQRQLESSEESARRRWQLNEIEKSIGSARYFPSDFRFRPRNPIFPVVARPRHFLRKRIVSVRCRGGVESDTFQVGHSTRSVVLRNLVRTIHGVVESDEEIVELVEDASQSSDDSPPRVVVPASGVREAARQSLDSEQTQNEYHRANDFSFSMMEEVPATGKTVNETFGSQDIHFSPGWTDAVSPLKTNAELTGTPNNKQLTPVRTVAARATTVAAARAIVTAVPSTTPATATAAVVVPTSREDAVVSARKETKSKPKPAVESSPVRGRAQGALSSPPMKLSKKERGKLNAVEQESKDSATSAAAKEFERGELLLQQLKDLVAESQAAESDLLCSPEPDARHSTQESGSQCTKTPPALPVFPRITRITRRLDFEAIGVNYKASTSKDNCIPEPPSAEFPVVPRFPSPELSPQEEPVFTLLPELSNVGNGHDDDEFVVSDKPESKAPEPPSIDFPVIPRSPSPELSPEEAPVFALLTKQPIDKGHDDIIVIEEPEPKELSKPRRSLALKKTVHYLDEDEDDLPLARVVQKRSALTAHADPVPTASSPSNAVFAPPAPLKPAPIVLEIDDFDDLDEVPAPAPTSKKPTNATIKEKVTPAALDRRETPSQRRNSDTTEHLGTQSDCCSVCTEVESYEDDPIVYCDGCDLGVHQFCYGIASLPSGNWFCDSCVVIKAQSEASGGSAVQSTAASPPSCHLCPLRGGALKRTLCGRWAHVQCFMWLPELQLVQDRDMLTLGSLKNLDPDRNTLDCSLCHSRKGRGIIQCAHKRCMDAFHISCASFAQYKLLQEEQDDGGETLFLAYCPLHGRKRNVVGVNQNQQMKAQVKTQQRTPVKAPAMNPQRNSASPSALLFSPGDQDSAKKFRKFRRLKRKYEASQSQSATTALAATLATATGDRRSSWGKRIKRSQQYSEGKRRQATAMARMFIEDDVEVHGEDEDDDDEDMDDDEANELEDSFINDSSQLIYSPASQPDSASKEDRKKKRKRSSPGDMRAIYAQSLLESQDVMPAFMRRGQRDFGALPHNGIINTCLQEMRNPPPSHPFASSQSSSSLFSPQSVRSRDENGAQQSPLSMTSPVGLLGSVSSMRTPTPSPSARKQQQRFGRSVGGIESKQLQYTLDDGEDDDFESVAVEQPSFSLLPTIQETPVASLINPLISVPQQPPPAPRREPEPRKQEEGEKKSDFDEDRSLQERIEANRRKALEKLRERQLKMAQAQSNSANGVSVGATRPNHQLQKSAALGNGQPTLSTNHPPPPPQTPLRNAGNWSTRVPAAGAVAPSQDNAVPEPPSFSLFPSVSSFSKPEPIAESRAMIDLTEDISEQQQQRVEQPVHRTPEVVVHVNSVFSQTQMFPTLIANRSLNCAVEIEDSLEADVLVSARLAVIVMPFQEFAAFERQQRSGNDFVWTNHPRVKTCSSIFKKVMIAIQVDAGGKDAAALNNNANLQRILRQNNSSNSNVDIVIRANDEQLCRHLFDTAKQEKDAGFSVLLPSAVPRSSNAPASAVQGVDPKFLLRFAYFRSIPCLSLGSALSLSFRFQNFAVEQMPVKKFNQMHWKRMLPWISEATAKQIQDHIHANAT